MKKTLVLLTALAVVLFAVPAMACSICDPGVNKRQEVQRHRIIDGVKSGELNRGEAHRLKREQIHIAQKERFFKSDGVLTKRERIHLHHSLDRSAKHIYMEKHDHQHRHW